MTNTACRFVPVSRVLPEERFLFRPLSNAPGFHRAVVRYGCVPSLLSRPLNRGARPIQACNAYSPLSRASPIWGCHGTILLHAYAECTPSHQSKCMRLLL